MFSLSVTFPKQKYNLLEKKKRGQLDEDVSTDNNIHSDKPQQHEISPSHDAIPTITSIEDETNAFGIQLRHRHDQIVSGQDFRLVRLIHLELGAAGTEKSGDDEVDFAVC